MRMNLPAGIALVLCLASASAYELPVADAPAGAEVYIVTFEAPGALNYAGGVSGLRNTARVIRSREMNAGANPDVMAYRDHLDGILDSHASQFTAALNRSVQPLLRYTVRTTGMAVLLTEAEAQHVARMPGVAEVRRDVMYELDTDAGPQWIGANAIWDGTATPGALPNKGEGVLVGVLDTGVNMDHPSFSDSPEDGYSYVNPFGNGVFLGDCDQVTFVCNAKLVGAHDFADSPMTAEADGPEDNNGHGSHTASTAAGNTIAGPIPVSGGSFPAPSVSGVAPHANLITYDVCFETCPGASIIGGIDQALLDGVDILNFSISGGLSPWTDADRGFLDLTANGTLVNASAGNTDANPDPIARVNHRGPWVNTVANQTHNRIAQNDVSAIGGPAHLQDMYGQMGGANLFGGMDVTEVGVFAGNYGDGQNFDGCDAWTGQYMTSFADQLVLISRGACNFSVKIDNAAAAGAEAVLVYNNAGEIPIAMGSIESTTIPALMIGLTDGTELANYLTNNPGTMVTMEAMTQRVIDNDIASFINPGSLRGPNNTFSVTKPDIGGPGTNVLAASADVTGTHPQYAFLSGTSMSSPHAAGASALLKSIHPDWSPTQIKSALMMTARQGFDELGAPATPDIEGSGTADLGKAALAGLTMDETFNDYLAANPAMGGDPATLNLPSMRANSCNGVCEWTRTVCNALDTETSWAVNHSAPNGYAVSVSHDNFSLLPDGLVSKTGFESMEGPTSYCQPFTVTVTVNDPGLVTAGQRIFDTITLVEQGAQSPDLKLTLAFLPTGVAP